MKFRRIFFQSIIVLFNVALLGNAFSAGGGLDAAVEILRAKYDIESNHQFCRDKAGEYGYKYDYIKYTWELKNRPYLQLSSRIFNDLPDSRTAEIKRDWKVSRDRMLSNRKKVGNVKNGKYCSRYFSRLLSGSIHELGTQKQNLAPRVGSVEDVRIIQRNTDMEVGCMKQGLNSDIRQFEAMRQACACQTELIVKSMSSKDIDKYLDLASSKNPQAAVDFITKRVNMQQLQGCYGQVGSR